METKEIVVAVGVVLVVMIPVWYFLQQWIYSLLISRLRMGWNVWGVVYFDNFAWARVDITLRATGTSTNRPVTKVLQIEILKHMSGNPEFLKNVIGFDAQEKGSTWIWYILPCKVPLIEIS